MDSGPPKPKNKDAVVTPRRKARADAAFDLWLQRGLHTIYDDIAKEPIPEDLLKLIEDDRAK